MNVQAKKLVTFFRNIYLEIVYLDNVSNLIQSLLVYCHAEKKNNMSLNINWDIFKKFL